MSLNFCLHQKTFAFLRPFCAILQSLAYFLSTISTRNLELLSRGSLVRVQHGSLFISLKPATCGHHSFHFAAKRAKISKMVTFIAEEKWSNRFSSLYSRGYHSTVANYQILINDATHIIHESLQTNISNLIAFQFHDRGGLIIGTPNRS